MIKIRPFIGAANTFSVRKLTRQLREQEIPYQRTVDPNHIKISFTNKQGEFFQYGFDSFTAKIRYKKKKSKNHTYETHWSNGNVSFSMLKNDIMTKIEKSITQVRQGFWNSLLHRKKQPYVLTEINKNISARDASTGWTKRIYEFNDKTTIIDIVPHHTLKIKRNGIQTKYRNATNDTVETALNFEINRAGQY